MTGFLILLSYFQLQKIVISHLFSLDACNTLQWKLFNLAIDDLDISRNWEFTDAQNISQFHLPAAPSTRSKNQ